MILSASRRADIPCFYGEWFINRLKAGYVLTRNPMNHAQLSRIPLTPDIIDCIVFWTKDAGNMIPLLETVEKMGYNYYFQFTLTPYDRTIEKNLRDKTDIVNTFRELSELIGKDRVLWRYDPVILHGSIGTDYHKEHFTKLCDRLYKYTESVTVSFADVYSKLKTDLIQELTDDEIFGIAPFIGKTAKNYGLTVKACSEKTDLTPFGIKKASCIDKKVIEKICASALKLKPDKNQRENCGCYESIDIGAYNTCPGGCIYCYANNGTAGQRNYLFHDPSGELLAGTVCAGEKITERKVRSCKI